MPAISYYTGAAVRFSTTGTLPAPLQPEIPYYLMVIAGSTYSLYDSAEAAISGGSDGKIILTDIGDGLHTMHPLGWRYAYHDWRTQFGPSIAPPGPGGPDMTSSDGITFIEGI